MRSLGISAIVRAACLAALSIIFIGLAYSDEWSGGSACSVAESLCRRPSLLVIPVTVAMAWGSWCWWTSKTASIGGWLKVRKRTYVLISNPECPNSESTANWAVLHFYLGLRAVR